MRRVEEDENEEERERHYIISRLFFSRLRVKNGMNKIVTWLHFKTSLGQE